MGLDQYIYVASKEGTDFDDPSRHDLGYRRKHPNLQGWMHKLWVAKGNSGDFNCNEVELTWDDVDMLEQAIKSGTMAKMGTSGFFFGHPSDDVYKEEDLQFCADAKAELFLGLKVFYNSSW